MGVLVALLSVLLVAATAGGGHAAPATTATAGEKSTVLGFRSASEVSAYWRAVLPNTPMPPAILERISGPPGDKGEDKKMENEHTWYPRTEDDAKKLVHGPSLSSEKILFPEDVFITAGSVIDLYIDSSATLRTACKSHEIADHVPMSMKDLNGILAKYAPTSLAMARDIWSTINVCEHARPVKGEQQTCTASIKTMVEFAVSVLGTSDLRAFSSPDVPAEGITSPAQRYKVAAARPVTTPAGAKASTMTCHSMEFPYPAYYCHAVNPTRVYEVTLQMEKGGAAAQGTTPAVMLRALAVCHLDSSGFDARMSFFVERGIKPGDAPACHFLSKGSVLWAPASWTGLSELVAAQ